MNDDMNVVRTSEIIVKVGLNAENMPVAMDWKASDNPNDQNFQSAKAMLMSFFDKDTKDTLKIDLWTNEMQVIEMDRFFYQTLRSLADTYYKATQNRELASAMMQFVDYFGEKTEIVPKGR